MFISRTEVQKKTGGNVYTRILGASVCYRTQASKMKIYLIECTNKTCRPPKLLISGQTSTDYNFRRVSHECEMSLSAKRLHS